MSAPCAWCEDESGQRTTGSHGICPRHFAEQIAELRARLVDTTRLTGNLAGSHPDDLRGCGKISARTTNGIKPTGNGEPVQSNFVEAFTTTRIASPETPARLAERETLS